MKTYLSLLLFFALSAVHTTPVRGDELTDGLQAVSGYDYGTDRTAIVAFDNYIRSQGLESRAKIEAALLPLLGQANISLGAKDYICRWLAVIGTDAAVPTLEKLTQDPQLSHLAVYALFSIDTPAARSALMSSLGAAPAALRPAIIGAIGRANVVDAVPALAKITTLDDPAQVSAALDALGAMGSSKALAALRDASVRAPLEATRQWALINAAFDVLKANPSAEAPRAVLASLLKPGAVSSIRVAAAKGYIAADRAGAWPQIAKLLKDDDVKVRLDVARLVAQFSPIPVASITAILPSLDPAVQVVIINSIAENHRAGIEAVLKAALASNRAGCSSCRHRGIRHSGYSGREFTLVAIPGSGRRRGRRGNRQPGATHPARRLRQARDGRGQDAGRGQGGRADDSRSPLGPLGARPVFRLDRRYGSACRASGFPGDQPIGGWKRSQSRDRLDAPGEDKRGAQQPGVALIHSTRAAVDKDQAADSLLAAVQQASPENKSMLIATLASVDSPKAIEDLQTLLKAPSVDDRKSVIRALSQVHVPSGDKLLLQAAAEGPDPSEKILALRGYLDSIRAQNLRAQSRIEAYRAAWPLATRQDDEQAILDALKNMNNRDAEKAYQELSATAPNPA